jgi:hypothetical protein
MKLRVFNSRGHDGVDWHKIAADANAASLAAGCGWRRRRQARRGGDARDVSDARRRSRWSDADGWTDT